MHTLTTPTVTEAMRVATKNRLGGSRVAGIVRAWHAIDARCVTCLTVTWNGMRPADATDGDRATFGHIVPAAMVTPDARHAGDRGGYTADNGVLQCLDCNQAMSDSIITRVYYVPAYLGTFPKTPRVSQVVDTSHKQDARLALGYV